MVSTVALQQEGPEFDSTVCEVSMFVVFASVLVGCSCFLPQSKEVRLSGNSEFPISVNGCVSLYVRLVTCSGCTMSVTLWQL